jgi:hypothetical protein
LDRSRFQIWKVQLAAIDLNLPIICKGNSIIKEIIENYLSSENKLVKARLISLLQNSNAKRQLLKCLEISLNANRNCPLLIENGKLVLGKQLINSKYQEEDIVHCLDLLLALEQVSLPERLNVSPQRSELPKGEIDLEFMVYNPSLINRVGDDIKQKLALLALSYLNCEFIALDFEFMGNKPDDNIKTDQQYDFETNVKAVLKYRICSLGITNVKSFTSSNMDQKLQIYQSNDRYSVWNILVHNKENMLEEDFLPTSLKYLKEHNFDYSEWVLNSIDVSLLTDFWRDLSTKILIVFNARMDLLHLLVLLGHDISNLKNEKELLDKIDELGIKFIDVKYVIVKRYPYLLYASLVTMASQLGLNIKDIEENAHNAAFDSWLAAQLLRIIEFQLDDMNKLVQYESFSKNGSGSSNYKVAWKRN